MDTLPFQRSGHRYCLLWKDFMQVRPTLIAILCGGLVMQLLLLVAERWFDHAQGGNPIIACLAPILFALGASGMLVGHERQSGSWESSRSLPVSWRSALASKLIVTTAGAILTGAALAVIPVALLLTERLVIDNTWLVIVYLSGLAIFALLEVVAYCFLASLLMRETLTALVIAGLGLCIAQVAIPALSLAIATDRLVAWGLTPDFASFLITLIASLGILAIGLFAMVATFRWRWTIGQRTVLGMRASATAAAVPSTAYVYSSTESPDSWWVLLRLAMASSLWLRVSAVAMGSLALLDLRELTLVALVLGSGILGLSAFEGDQAHQRYRFLADRGIAPWKLVVSRLDVAFAWMLGLWCILGYSGLTSAGPGGILTIELCSLAFLVSALAAICFRNPVVAATVSMVVFIGGLMAYGLSWNYAIELTRQSGSATDYEVFDKMLRMTTLMLLPLTMLVFLVAIFRAARRWIVVDGLHLPIYFTAAVAVGLVLPVAGVFGVYASLLASNWPAY